MFLTTMWEDKIKKNFEISLQNKRNLGIKPESGLWLTINMSWIDFYLREIKKNKKIKVNKDFKLKNVYKFVLNDKNYLKLKTLEDYIAFYEYLYDINFYFGDVYKKYDGIIYDNYYKVMDEIRKIDDEKLESQLWYAINVLDCNCVVVFNKDSIKSFELLKNAKVRYTDDDTLIFSFSLKDEEFKYLMKGNSFKKIKE